MINTRKGWTEEEDESLSQAVKRLGFKSWALIATNLTKMFGGPRSGKQCRQRWHNHLNPDIQKKSWTKKEQESLFALHKIHGNKWTIITESLPGRTDNAIKNYFYSTIRRSLRRIGKFLGSKNSTIQMKDIKPSTLSKIFAADSELFIDDFQAPQEQELIRYIREHSEMVRSYIIKFTHYKPTKSQKVTATEKQQLQEVIRKMIFINETYQRLKKDDKFKKIQKEDQQMSNRNISSESEEAEKFSDESSEQKNIREDKLSDQVYINKMKVTRIKSENSSPSKQFNEPRLETFNQYLQNEYYQKKIPTASIKSQPQSNKDNEIGSLFDMPEFAVDLKDEGAEVPRYIKKQNMGLNSPGFFFTPSHNPFTYFYSPSTPQSSIDSSLSSGSFGVLHHSTLDEFQVMIQREIESNLKGEQKIASSSSNSTTTIGASPGSAFSYYL